MFRSLIITAGIALAMPAFAQSTIAVDGKRPARVSMAEKLGLTGPQAQRVKSIMKASREERLALRVELLRTGDRQAKRAIRDKLKAAKADTRQKLAQVLSVEQMRKYDTMRPTPPKRKALKAA